MELSDDLLEQIGAYLSGQLPDGEKEQFEARLRQDTALQQEVAIQRELKEGLSFLAQKDRFRQLHTDLDRRGLLTGTDTPTTPSATGQPQPAATASKPLSDSQPVGQPVERVRSVFRYGLAAWAMAAALVLLLGIGWVVYSNQMEARQEVARNEAMFSRFFSPVPRPSPTLPADPDRLAASPDNGGSTADSLRLQAAIRRLQQPDFQPALSELKALSTQQPGHWTATAQWYLVLAYLKNNQRTEAQTLLQTVAQQTGHPYQPDARRLLNQLTTPPSD